MKPDIMQLAESGQADELRETLRKKALESLYFFSKVVMGYKDLTETLHLEFCDHIQSSKEVRKRGYLYPRGHFKSTIVAKCYPMWRILPTQPQDPPEIKANHDPNTRILLVSESDTVASKNLRDPKWHLQNNQMLKWLFPEIIPPDTNKTKWTDTEILLPRSKTFDESTITSIGVGAKTTGFHYDIIVYDDMIGEKASKSPAEMESAINWFQLAPGLLNDNMFGEELIIGTRWLHGKADLYGWIMKELAFGTMESGRATGFTWHIRAAIEDGVPIFPERFSLEVLDEIRRREKDYKFSCQYLNNPTSPEGADYPPEWLKEFKISEDLKYLIPEDGTPKVALVSLLRNSFYDPSTGGRSAECEAAIAFVGMAADGRKFILDCWGANTDYGSAIEKWHQLNDKYQCYLNQYEKVGAQKAVDDVIRERLGQIACRACGKTHRPLRQKPFTPDGRNKEDRIRAYSQADFQAGKVYIRQGLSELRRQIVSFPFGDLVDQFDATAYALHNARKPLSDEYVAEEKEREERARVMHNPRIATEHDYGGYA